MLGVSDDVTQLGGQLAGSHIDPATFLRRQTLQRNPLLSPELALARIAIFSPAVNSSGDIYHIAAYLMLCRHFNWTVPKVYIGSDTPGTFAQAERGKALLTLLDFGGDCEIIRCNDPGSFQASPRSAEMRKQLQARNVNSVDQKITTALLAMAYFLYGHAVITSILHQGFVAAPWAKVDKNFGTHIHAWLNKKIEKISAFAGNKPFVILHDRQSDTANSGQSLSAETKNKITAYLETQGICVFIIAVTDKTVSVEKNSTTVFEPEDKLNGQYDKFRHIQLLHAISCMHNFLGVIGGTSGTLDIIAFLGIRVFNIHNFKPASSDRSKLIPYQDFRILLQVQFMTVCRGTGANPLDSTALSFLHNWITRAVNYRFPLFPHQRQSADKSNCDDHNDRVPFKYCLLPQKPVDREEYDWRAIKRETGSLYVVAANKFFDLQKAWVNYNIVPFEQLHRETKAFATSTERPLCTTKYPKDDTAVRSKSSPYLEPQSSFEAHF